MQRRIRCGMPIVVLSALVGCKSAPAPSPVVADAVAHYLARPSVAAPPVKLFHRDDDTLTLTTKADATDAEIAAIVWAFRDAAHAHSFASLGLPQAFIDARKPKVWFHVYRGPKCATEKYIQGKYPCGASYHGAGDYTLGSYQDPAYEDGVVLHADGTQVQLWNPDQPSAKPPGK